MSLLPAPVNQHHSSGLSSMHDRISPSTYSPHQQDGYYNPSPPSPVTDQQGESPGSVGQSSDPARKSRKFICQYCQRKFLRAEHLRRHEITHTGDKPFRCPYCKEAFSRSDILKRHIAKCRAATGSEHIHIEPETPNAPPRRACDRCARLKVRCDFIQPCGRCSRQSMDCTYHRLNSNKANGTNDERRSSQVSVNGNGMQLPPPETTNMNGMSGMNQQNEFPNFPSSFSFNQTQTAPSPPRMLPPPLNSPSLGLYNLQHTSPQDRLNHISPPNNANPSTGLSPFNSFPNLSTPGPSLMDLSHAASSHQPIFAQNMDLDQNLNPSLNQNIDHNQNLDLNPHDPDVLFASSDPSEIIFNNHFSADDTFFTWKPFEYNVNNDATFDFLFGPDIGYNYDMFSPNDMAFPEMVVPVAPTAPNDYEDPDKSSKEEVPDQGIVATFDPGTDETANEIPQSHPPSRAGPRTYSEYDYINLIQIDPLQARCEALIIAVLGSLENLNHQDTWIQEFFTTDHIKSMLFLWARRYAQHVPIIHLPTFSILTAPDDLLFVLIVIGQAYSPPSIDAKKLQWCIEAFNKLSAMARVDGGELDLVSLEAAYIVVVLCTWHGNKQQREMAKRLYRDIVDTVRQRGYCQVIPQRETDGSDEADWKAWIEQETRIRFIMNVYLMDGGLVVFFNTRPVLQFQEVQLPFPCDGALWAAPTAAAWRKEMAKPRERDWLPQTLDALIRASLRPEDDHTDLYGKFLLIHGLINYIWERQYELDCQTDPFPGDIINFRTSTARAINNWRTLWDTMIPRLKMDRGQWSRLGFFRNSLEYWYAAKLFLAKPRSTPEPLGWGQPYGEDKNVFSVKRLLRIVRVWVVRGESKAGLTKRDLSIPGLLNTLKIIIPELGHVRIEEAPSAVPSPRPIWNHTPKKEENKN